MRFTKRNIYLLIVLVLISVGLISYDESDFKSDLPLTAPLPPVIKKPLNSFDNKSIPKKILALNSNPTYKSKQGDIEDNLFGRFLYDRAAFYIIKEPKNQLFSSNINSITLVYLDNNLYKTKYVLSSDIVAALITKYGRFTSTGFDFINRDLLTSPRSFSSQNGIIKLSNKLNNYQLLWQLNGSDIIYRVNTTHNQSVFEYTKRRSDYEQMFRIVENGS